MPSENETCCLQLESDSSPARRYAPRYRELRLQFLRQAVDANQDSAGQIADGFRRSIGDQQRIEGLGFGVEGESKFAASLRRGAAGGRIQQE